MLCPIMRRQCRSVFLRQVVMLSTRSCPKSWLISRLWLVAAIIAAMLPRGQGVQATRLKTQRPEAKKPRSEDGEMPRNHRRVFGFLATGSVSHCGRCRAFFLSRFLQRIVKRIIQRAKFRFENLIQLRNRFRLKLLQIVTRGDVSLV